MELHIATYMIEVSPVMSVTPRINQALIFFIGGKDFSWQCITGCQPVSPAGFRLLHVLKLEAGKHPRHPTACQHRNIRVLRYWISDGGSEPYSSMPNMPRDFRTYRKILGACNDKCWTTRRLSWHPVEGMRPTKPRWPKVPTSQPTSISFCVKKMSKLSGHSKGTFTGTFSILWKWVFSNNGFLLRVNPTDYWDDPLR